MANILGDDQKQQILALGRLGCFAAGCCFGKVCEAPWAVVFSHPETLAPPGLPLHPTQIYEALFLAALGAFLLWRLNARRARAAQPSGIVFAEYLLLYSAGRFALEFFRWDEPRFGGLTPAQITSIILFAIAAFARFKLFLTKPTPI